MRKLAQMYSNYNTKKFEATVSILDERRCLISGYYSCPTIKGHFNRDFSTAYRKPCYFFHHTLYVPLSFKVTWYVNIQILP